MEIVPIYDRSALIRSAMDNVSETLVDVVLTVSFIVLLFLWHVPSALIPVINQMTCCYQEVAQEVPKRGP